MSNCVNKLFKIYNGILLYNRYKMEKLDEIVLEFNAYLVSLVNDLIIIAPDSILAQHKSKIIRFIDNPKNKELFIKEYIKYVIEDYQEHINEKNEKLFEQLLDQNGGDNLSNNIKNDKMFQMCLKEIKKYWPGLNSEEKDNIFQTFIYMGDVATIYMETLIGL